MKKIKLIGLLLVFVVIWSFTACGNNTATGEPIDSQFAVLPLNASPVAPQGESPKVLDSYTDGASNYYLIDAGYIRNVYISTLAQVEYTGAPISFTKVATTSSQVTNSLTETISKSHYWSRTDSTNIGIAFEEKAQLGVAGNGVEFTAKQSFDWMWTGTTSDTNLKSTTNTLESANSYAESQTIAFTFESNSAELGRYRYALYGLCDVFYLTRTSVDRQTLLGLDVNVCARPNEYFVRSEYSKNGIFSNEPDDIVTFAEDFYKLLPPAANKDKPTMPDLGDVDNFSGGYGTEKNPYIISTKQHFQNMQQYADKCFILNCDINLGYWDSPFEFFGTLNGDGHKISYFLNVKDSDVKNYGLFTVLNNAHVEDLVLEYTISSNKLGKDLYVGGLAAVVKNKSIISKVHVHKSSEAFVDTNGKSYLGGLIG